MMALVSPELGLAVTALLLVAVFGAGWAVGRLGLGRQAVKLSSLSDLERRFVDRMRGVVLMGSFTTVGDEGAPRSDRYEIEGVEKVGDNLWRFNVSMHCCGVDGAIPVVVPMEWHGDTPMIMMTDTRLPGLGTFTVRLFFQADAYAGTWRNGAARGEMSGRIVPARAPQLASQTSKIA